MNTRKRRRGIALFLTLGFTTLLVMMLAATITSSHGGNIFTQDYHRKTAALYAAESGLALMQARLESDPHWNTDLVDEPTTFETGTYTVRFTPSINNLKGLGEIDSPYGPVLPGTAFLQIEGKALGQTEVIECIVGRKSEDFLHAAIIATGKIFLDGSVRVSGRISSDELSSAEADVISNFDQDAPWGPGIIRPVYWADSPATGDEVRGTVRSASPALGAISTNLVSISDQALTNQAPVPVQNVNIKRAIQSKSGVSQSVPISPTAPLNGDYYQSGSITVTGDLVLNDASLYIQGNLEVLGSIRGVGAVYVGGDTKFSGDSVVVANEDGVVLYSQGNVHLRGFDGTAWMDAVTAAHGETAAWQDTKESFRLLNEYMQDYDGGDNTALRPPPGTLAGEDEKYWASQAGLVLAGLGAPVEASVRALSEDNLLYRMLQVIDSEPSGRTQAFMRRKFTALRDPDRVSATSPPLPGAPTTRQNINGALGINYGHPVGADAGIVQEFISGPELGETRNMGLQLELWLKAAELNGEVFGPPNLGNYVGLTVEQLNLALTKHSHWLNLYDFDRLGASYFQGNIYTRGAFYASNEVTIIGSLSAVADPQEPMTAWSPPDGGDSDSSVSLKPGDVHLGRGTRILHVGDLLPGPRATFPPVGVSQWLR